VIALTIGLAVVVGISLGLLGGGGSILMVPLLVYVAGMEAKPAIATSLLVVGVTSAFAAITHARAGRVRWRVGAVFGAAAMAGAYGGGLLARFIPGSVLLIAFAIIMIAAAMAMLRGRNTTADESVGSLPVVKILLQGAAVGVISGLVGAGGGFLLVPALALLGGLSMPVAVGTSLVVISMQSFAGFAGSVIGGRLTSYVAPNALRKAFGWFVLAMAAVVLAEETQLWIGAVVGGVTLVAGAMSFACARFGYCPLRRLISGGASAGDS